MTWKRKLAYAILHPILKLFVTSFWWTCRVEKIIGDEHAQKLLERAEPIIPCYWHQMHIFGTWYMRKLNQRGLKIGFLVSRETVCPFMFRQFRCLSDTTS